MKYLGLFQADVKMDGVKLIRLIHPDGGFPYALTYRGQQILSRGMVSGQKPRIMLIGHLHTMYSFLDRNVWCFGVASFEGQTSFLVRKGINPTIGGWIIKVKFGEDAKKSIISLTSEFIPFYE